MSLPGVDLAALRGWLDAEHPGLRSGELRAELIAGGKSNLTYRVTDGVTTWALRRPPLAHVLPTAHDMAREYRVVTGLASTTVPVARTVAFCDDVSVLGAPFYLMSFVDGVVLDRQDAVDALDRPAARRVGEQLVDVLVALHAVDPASVGLADFGRPEGFLDRQLRRWSAQWEASQARPLPVFDAVVERLRAGRPASPAPSIVHGDYRLTNVIYRPALDGIAAVVDWEMATLGDPLTDVGLLVVYHTLALDMQLTMPRMSLDAGFLSPEELVERYAAGSTREPAGLCWYVAFGYFKLAVISEGIAARHRQGKTVGAGFERFEEMVPALLERALATLEVGMDLRHGERTQELPRGRRP